MYNLLPLFFALAFFAATGLAGYTLEDDYFAQSFLDQFDFFTGNDPTQGFVEWLGETEAKSRGIVNSTVSSAYLGVDAMNKSATGRASVRITSKKSYDSGLIVADISHMPNGECGTWPAFWMTGPDWPMQGEIDILEGINDQTENDITLHTGLNCSISDEGGFTGKMTYTSCYSGPETENTGCQIASNSSNTYGQGFNEANGGVFAMDWTGSTIDVYFFPNGTAPEDVLSDSPDPSAWGMPLAHFAADCDMSQAFRNQQIIFETDFCGSWAGNMWSSNSACMAKANQGTCDEYVQNNPAAFSETYWTINALKVYQKNGNSSSSASASSASATPSSVSPSSASATPSSASASSASASSASATPSSYSTSSASALSSTLPTSTSTPASSTQAAPSSISTSAYAPPSAQVSVSTYVATLTSIVYVTQPPAETSAASSASSYVPVVGGGGVVQEEDFTASQGSNWDHEAAVFVERGSRSDAARHLRRHVRRVGGV